MEESYRKELIWWFAELTMDPEVQVERYLTIFPELKSRLSKFGVGILLWNMKGLVDIDNPDDVSRVRLILKVLDQTPGFDFFDNVFNKADPDTVCGIIGMSSKVPVEASALEFDYTVDSISSYEDARQYLDMTSWCIVISEESFKDKQQTAIDSTSVVTGIVGIHLAFLELPSLATAMATLSLQLKLPPITKSLRLHLDGTLTPEIAATSSPKKN